MLHVKRKTKTNLVSFGHPPKNKRRRKNDIRKYVYEDNFERIKINLNHFSRKHKTTTTKHNTHTNTKDISNRFYLFIKAYQFLSSSECIS